MRKKYKKILFGFTLIELLVVSSILIILSLLLFLVYQHQIGRAYDSKRKSDVYDIKIALEEYEKDHNCYPDFISCEGGYADDLQPYLQKIPCDPETKKSYVYYPDPSSSSCHKWYWIFSNLDDDSDPKIDDLGCTNGCGPTESETDYDYYASSSNAPDPYFGIPFGYGCHNGVCEENTSVCFPNYDVSDCHGMCGTPGNPQNQCN